MDMDTEHAVKQGQRRDLKKFAEMRAFPERVVMRQDLKPRRPNEPDARRDLIRETERVIAREADVPPAERYAEDIAHVNDDDADEEEKPTRRILKVATLDDLAARPKPSYLIEGYIPGGRLAGLVGPSQIGKSFVALSMSACIASDVDWHGHKAKHGHVLYVGAEGADAFWDRMKAWEFANEITIPRDRLLFADEWMSLSDDDSVEWTKAAVDEYGIDLVVFDTFSQLSGVESENDAAQVARVLRTVKAIRDAGNVSTAALVVHHNAKEGKRYRGSTAFFANLDTVITADGTASDFSLSLRAEDGGKLKDGKAFRETGFALVDSLNSAVVARTVAPDRVQDALTKVLSDGLDHVLKDFQDQLDDYSSATSKKIRRLLNRPGITATGDTKAKRWRDPKIRPF